jgi:hypothetical protein
MSELKKFIVLLESAELEFVHHQSIDKVKSASYFAIKHKNMTVNVEWRTKLGFAVLAYKKNHAPPPFSSAQVVLDSAEQAFELVRNALFKGLMPQSAEPLTLGQARLVRRKSQAEIAKRMSIDASVVTKRENADIMNMKLASVVAFASALDCTVELALRFPDAHLRPLRLN